jgi:hypothetical protein
MPSSSCSAKAQRLHDLSVRWPSDQVREWAEKTLPELCPEPSILAVVLFGSCVRPVEFCTDLDCLVVYSDSRPEFPDAPIDVDVRAYQEGAVRDLALQGHDLLGWALRLGLLVCERGEYWSRLRSELLPCLPLPSPESAQRRAEQAARLLHELRSIGDEEAAAEQYLTLLTHRARAALLGAGIFPTSRPELPAQLREVSEPALAEELDAALEHRRWRAGTLVGVKHPAGVSNEAA